MKPEEIEALSAVLADVVREQVETAIAPLQAKILELEAREPVAGPPGKDGADGRDGKDGEPGAKGADGRDGRDGEPGAKGEDGRDGKDGEPGAKGTDGRDGVGLAGALIDRNGELVVTLTDGTTRQLGAVVGKDGENGPPGRDGADGLGFDDLSVESHAERGFTFRFARGEQVKRFDFNLPVIIDRGVYRATETYERGDAVSWGGSLWIAQADAPGRPGEGDSWRLAVKKGRDGKNGIDGAPGERGRDLTQLGSEGQKW